MAAGDIDVAHVANLARINLTDEETQLFREQLQKILDHANKLKEVDVSGVDALSHAEPVFNVFRGDQPSDGLSQEEALKNAPRQASGLFIVPKVVE